MPNQRSRFFLLKKLTSYDILLVQWVIYIYIYIYIYKLTEVPQYAESEIKISIVKMIMVKLFLNCCETAEYMELLAVLENSVFK